MNVSLKVAGVLAAMAIAATACGSVQAGSPPNPGASAWTSPPGYTPPPQPAANTTTTPAAPQLSPQKVQVLESALTYITDGEGFSKAGLFQQLHSSYGEGFSARLARWAVNRVGSARVWRQQAVDSAKTYMQSGQGFSCSGLIQQLDSPYGEQFTYAQAVYGADRAHAC